MSLAVNYEVATSVIDVYYIEGAFLELLEGAKSGFNRKIILTINVLDCDHSNYSSCIIFSYTFTLEPNTNWTG